MMNSSNLRPESGPESRAVPPVSVLLVDDNPTFLGIANRFLEDQTPARVRVLGTAATGEEGVALAQQLRPQVLVLDLNLPGQSGLEVLGVLQRDCPETKVVVLTMFEGDSYRTVALAAGAHGFVTKAALNTELIPAILSAAAQPPEALPAAARADSAADLVSPPPAPVAPASAPASQPSQPSLPMKIILVTDDSGTMRRMVMASLATLPGVQFDQAGSGLEAIERLALAPSDLMVLDLNMPDMHGLEVLRFLRAHPIYQRIPVVVLTTKSDATSRADALAAGASAYLTKPFQPAALAACVRQLLPLS